MTQNQERILLILAIVVVAVAIFLNRRTIMSVVAPVVLPPVGSTEGALNRTINRDVCPDKGYGCFNGSGCVRDINCNSKAAVIVNPVVNVSR